MKKAFFEAAFVVLGVVLALLANEWRQSAHNNAEARAALSSIHEELEANRQSVKQSRDYHAQKLEATTGREETSTLDVRQFDKGFIFPASVSRSAWDTASETGALANMPFARVRALSQLYDQQAAYQRQVTANSNIIYRTLFENGIDGIAKNPDGLATMLRSFSYRETQLLQSYSEFLD